MDDTYRAKPEPFWLACQLRQFSAVETMDVVRKRGHWNPVPVWGTFGWGLGRWPRQVLYHRQQGSAFELATSVDGQVECWSFPSRELRDAATDEIAFSWWKEEQQVWLDRVQTFAEMPDDLRGPYEPASTGTATLVVVQGGVAEVITEDADVVILDVDQWRIDLFYRQRWQANLDRLQPTDREWVQAWRTHAQQVE